MVNDISRFLPPSSKNTKTKATTIKSEDINAAISMTDDGSTCIFCDYNFTEPPEFILLDMYSATIHIVGGDFGIPGVHLQYPLEYDKIEVWKDKKTTYFSHVGENKAENMYELEIVFANGDIQ